MTVINQKYLTRRICYLTDEVFPDVIETADVELEGALINEQILDFNALPAKVLNALEVLELRSLLATTLPKLVSYDKRRLEHWARDAYSFYLENWQHSDFKSLFSQGLNYDLIICDCMKFSDSTEGLKKAIEDLTSIDLTGLIAKTYGFEYTQALQTFAKESVSRALFTLAEELLDSRMAVRPPETVTEARLQQIRANASFRSNKGVIQFHVAKSRLQIGSLQQHRQTEVFRGQLDRTLRRMKERRILERVHNRDPELSSLFSEYEEELAADSPEDSALSLWFIGGEIERRVRFSPPDPDADGALDHDTRSFVSAFLIANDIYLQSFPEIEKLGALADQASNLYRSVAEEARSTPWFVLGQLSREADLFDPRSHQVVEKASSAITGIGDKQSKGLVTIGFGLLRGSLKALAHYLLFCCIDLAAKASEDTFSEVIKKVFEQGGLEQKAINFFLSNAHALSQMIKQFPTYFHWIDHLLAALQQ